MKSHRGIATIVATVFLVAIVVGALTYISYSLETMANFSEQLVANESRQRNIQNEKYEIISVDITPGDKLDAVIKNTGQIPLELTTLWIDETDSDDAVMKISIDKTIAPGKSFDFLTENIDIDIDSTKGYTMKLISSRGETQTFYLNSANQESLDIQLFGIPEIIPDEFSSTIMMTVVNNMSNNNVLLNLTPTEPLDCSSNPDCEKISGPIPASYDSLNSGDTAIFRWNYKLEGASEDTFDFQSGLQNGVPGNEGSATVTIGTPPFAEVAGQSLIALGIGQATFGNTIFILHSESFNIPAAADYQLTTIAPDTAGTTLVMDTGVSYQFFSANVTVQDVVIDAGNWNASLRYNSPRLPAAMDLEDDKLWQPLGYMAASNQGGGHTFHFNDASNGMYDSGTDPICTHLSDGPGGAFGATWGANFGVNGTGAYYLDGVDDYLKVKNLGTKGVCNYVDKVPYSLSGWFKAAINPGHDNKQAIFSTTHPDGDIKVEVSDNTAGNEGHLFFTHVPKGGSLSKCESEVNYMDDEWHHFVATGAISDGTCKLYVDGTLDATTTSGNSDHIHNPNDIFIGAKSDSAQDPFKGYLDDIMFWLNHTLSQTDVTALHETSFGENAHQLNFYLNNATGDGTTVDNLSISLNYPLPYVDMGRYTAVNDLWAGGNYTINLPLLNMTLAAPNRLNFTMSYAGGLPMNLNIDNQDLDGTVNLLSTYLQLPHTADPLPVFVDIGRFSKITLFAFNVGDKGAWFTSQGTRLVLNGTNGNYASIVDTISNGVDPAIRLNGTQDSPFVANNQKADIIFWQPNKTPVAGSPPTPDDFMPAGTYELTVFLNGYDEDGIAFLRSIALGTVKVVE